MKFAKLRLTSKGRKIQSASVSSIDFYFSHQSSILAGIGKSNGRSRSLYMLHVACYWSVTLDPMELAESVIPGLTRNPVEHPRIAAFAGMTWFSLYFGVTGCYKTRPCHHSDSPAARMANSAATAANRAVISVCFFSKAIFAVSDS